MRLSREKREARAREVERRFRYALVSLPRYWRSCTAHYAPGLVGCLLRCTLLPAATVIKKSIRIASTSTSTLQPTMRAQCFVSHFRINCAVILYFTRWWSGCVLCCGPLRHGVELSCFLTPFPQTMVRLLPDTCMGNRALEEERRHGIASGGSAGSLGVGTPIQNRREARRKEQLVKRYNGALYTFDFVFCD